VVQVSPLPLQVFFYFFLGVAFVAGFAAGLLVWGFGLPHPHLLPIFVTSLSVIYQKLYQLVRCFDNMGGPRNAQQSKPTAAIRSNWHRLDTFHVHYPLVNLACTSAIKS
jgi:hypothetical protein